MNYGGAQTQQHIPDSSVRTSADTGAFARGPQNYDRYTVPEECVAAVQNAIDVYRRSIAVQLTIATIRSDAPERDSLPHDVAMIARACAAKFTTKGIPDKNLPALFTLALLESNDSLAGAILHRRLTLAAADTEEMQTILQDAMSEYLNASPARVATAEAIAVQLDTVGGKSGIDARLAAHKMLLNFATSFADENGMRREAERIIALVKSRATPTPSDGESIKLAYSGLLLIAYIDHEADNGDAAGLAIAQQVKQDLIQLKLDANGMRNALPDSIRDQLLFWSVSSIGLKKYSAPGMLPPVTASYWFPKKPDVWPAERGQGALIVNGQFLLDNCIRDALSILVNPLRHECKALYTSLYQWATLYRGRLAVTLVSMTNGYVVRSVALEPAREADSIAWFLRDYLKLPVTVAVVQDSIYQMPPPDSRRFRLDTAFYGHGYWIEPGGRGGTDDFEVIYYGPSGKLRYVGRDFDKEALFRTLLAHDLASPPSTSTISPSPTAILPSQP